MAKKKAKFHKKPSRTVSLAIVGGFVPLALNVYNGFKTGGVNGAGFELVRGTTGYNWQAGRMEWQALVRGMGPVAAGFGVHKLASWFGVNRALARAGIPFFRI